jgi:glycosyltransferase involved in cell wall biosynthesis
MRLTQHHLRSYQQNSVVAETDLQCQAGCYDLIHFVDAEHTGLLSALVRLRFPDLPSPKLIATFHQPAAIMEKLVSDPAWLGAFDAIQLMAPDQSDYLGIHTDPERLVCIPHGIAHDLLSDECQSGTGGGIPEKFSAELKDKSLLLTVGSWLRDFDRLLATAKALEHRDDLAFVVVSKNLELEIEGSSNVYLLNQGISDEDLQALYSRAALLFLPLQCGAANNALLEAMAHGLPIVSTDIPAIGFYSGGLATTVPPNATTYAKQIERTLNELRNPERRDMLSQSLRRQAATLKWENIANRMLEELYLPLLESCTPVNGPLP